MKDNHSILYISLTIQVLLYDKLSVFRIRIGLNTDLDPDPAFEVNMDPDPGFLMIL